MPIELSPVTGNVIMSSSWNADSGEMSSRAVRTVCAK